MTPEKNPLFSLKPISEQAKKIVNDAANGGINSHLVLFGPDGVPMLGVGHHASQSSTPGVLALLGRSDSVDIHLKSSSVSRIQASFEINPQSNAVMFVDLSPSESSQVYGENNVPFEHERSPRKIVINSTMNTQIGMGGSRRDHITFELIWHHSEADTTVWINDLKEILEIHDYHTRPETISQESDTSLSSRRETRIHSRQKRQMRYVVGDQLGSGNRGTVFKGMNLDTGDLMAVKVMSRPAREQSKILIKSEIETLVRLQHPHIVDYIGTDLTDSYAAIFMRLMDDNLLSLINKPELQCHVFQRGFLHQMLQALDYLDCHSIIHGDIKPSNILYVKGPDSEYHFQLADFGLAGTSKSRRGTHPYMAPEVFYGDAEISTKIDIWSLCMTLLCMTKREAWSVQEEPQRAHDGSGPTREDVLNSYERVRVGYTQMLLLSQLAFMPYFEIQDMARINPENRASAAQMLARNYNGRGLTTRSSIPAISKPKNDYGILQEKHRLFLMRMEKRRLMKEWTLNSSDLLTDDGTEDEEDELGDENKSDCTDDTVFMIMHAEMEKELANQAMNGGC